MARFYSKPLEVFLDMPTYANNRGSFPEIFLIFISPFINIVFQKCSLLPNSVSFLVNSFFFLTHAGIILYISVVCFSIFPFVVFKCFLVFFSDVNEPFCVYNLSKLVVYGTRDINRRSCKKKMVGWVLTEFQKWLTI